MKKPMEAVYRVFGARVEHLRVTLGMTQLDLAKKVGLTRPSIANIEAGNQRVLLYDVERFAAAFSITPRNLMKGIWLMLAACAVLSAAPILSDGNETCLPAPCAVRVITPHPSWIQEALWISHADSGANASMLTVANGTVVSFFERFTIAGIAVSAPLRFAADDSAALWVNGSLVVPEAAGGGYSVCSDTAPTCWQWYAVDIAPWLAEGANELRFDVAQRGRYGFGLSFAGDLRVDEDPPAETPEPGTAILVIGAIMAQIAWQCIAYQHRQEIEKSRARPTRGYYHEQHS